MGVLGPFKDEVEAVLDDTRPLDVTVNVLNDVAVLSIMNPSCSFWVEIRLRVSGVSEEYCQWQESTTLLEAV